MADFLNEFVKTVMDDNIRENYPHVRQPALLVAEVKETMTLEDQPFVTLQILTEKGEADEAFPLLPYVRTEASLQAGDIVVIGLLYGGCTPYILGRYLDDIGRG